jgi:DNA-binding IclR family transcriptional regulator
MSPKSVHKALDILETLALTEDRKGELSISEISKALELPTSTVSRLLAPLVDKGLAFRNPATRRYGLTLKVADLGASAFRRVPLNEAVRNVLAELVRSAQETASLVWLYGYLAMYVVEIPCDATVRASHRIGAAAPLHCAALGKVLLAALDPSDIESYITETGLPEYTRYTITNAYALREQLEEIRQQGFAIDKQEWELGAGSVAALVADSAGDAVGAIGVTGPLTRLEEKGFETLAHQVMLGASRASAAHGFKPASTE